MIPKILKIDFGLKYTLSSHFKTLGNLLHLSTRLNLEILNNLLPLLKMNYLLI